MSPDLITVVRRVVYMVLLLLWIALLESILSLDRAAAKQSLPSEIHAIEQLAAGIRHGLATVLWVRLDEYLHASDPFRLTGLKKTGPGPEPVGVSATLAGPELFPLARLITALDPTFVRAGIILSGALLRVDRKRDEANRLIQALIRANPDHPRLFLLYAALGRDRFARKEFRTAVPALEKAVTLYPRVKDPALLARLDEPPADRTDEVVYEGALAALVTSLVELGEYEAALRWWLRASGFAPQNKVVQTLIRYRQQKARGKVDPADLALFYKKAAELEVSEPGEKPPKSEEDLRKSMSGAERGPGMDRVRRPVEVLVLGLPARQMTKLMTILGIMALAIVIGRFRGWIIR